MSEEAIDFDEAARRFREQCQEDGIDLDSLLEEAGRNLSDPRKSVFIPPATDEELMMLVDSDNEALARTIVTT